MVALHATWRQHLSSAPHLRARRPECYDCKGKITEKVDVWALGGLTLELQEGSELKNST